jgi:hypothetical protein
MKPNVNSRRTSRCVAACIAAGVLVASCGSDDPDSSSTATVDAGTSAVEATTPESSAPAETESTASADTGGTSGDPCADRDALRSSLSELVDVDVIAEGTNGLTAAIDTVKEDLSAVQESAGDEIQSEVDAVRSALDDVETAVSNGATNDVAGTATALAGLASAGSDLLAALDEGACASEVPTTT